MILQNCVLIFFFLLCSLEAITEKSIWQLNESVRICNSKARICNSISHFVRASHCFLGREKEVRREKKQERGCVPVQKPFSCRRMRCCCCTSTNCPNQNRLSEVLVYLPYPACPFLPATFNFSVRSWEIQELTHTANCTHVNAAPRWRGSGQQTGATMPAAPSRDLCELQNLVQYHNL